MNSEKPETSPAPIDHLRFHRPHAHLNTTFGNDAFALRADKDPVDALKAFEEFSEVYQASTDQPLPLFRRRA